MIYQELLYSRSLSRDYRWMIIPPKISQESLKVLNQLYNLYDKYKHVFEKSSVSPLYCLNHTDVTFLVSCGLSNYKDKDGRDIYCLQGISVTQEYRRYFWFILPWILLTNYEGKGLLNIWKNIDFSGADDIVRRASEDYAFGLDRLDEPLAKLIQTPGSLEKLHANEPAYIPFDRNGLKELSHLLLSYNDCTDFAFGATPEIIKKFNFKIIAKVGHCSKRKNSAGTFTADVTPFPVSNDGQVKSIDEHFNDPTDRFDPRKKKVGMINKVKLTSTKNRLLGGNVSSRIVSQFFPRLLSVFKIDRILKRPKSSGQQ